jgi:hypothetical protein
MNTVALNFVWHLYCSKVRYQNLEWSPGIFPMQDGSGFRPQSAVQELSRQAFSGGWRRNRIEYE